MKKTSILHHTTILINKWLPKDLANLVLKYFKAVDRDWISISISGEYETCLRIPNSKSFYGLEKACCCGYMELAKLMITKGANLWNWCLGSACRCGHKELAELMILHGADDWNSGLFNACLCRHPELAKLMIFHGATECPWCCKPMNEH